MNTTFVARSTQSRLESLQRDCLLPLHRKLPRLTSPDWAQESEHDVM